MPPERFGQGAVSTFKVDVFAIGVILYILIQGELPHPFQKVKDDGLQGKEKREAVEDGVSIKKIKRLPLAIKLKDLLLGMLDDNT